MPVTVPWRSGKAQDDDVGPEPPDHPNNVAEDLIVAPFVQCFLRRLGKAKINRSTKKLFRAVDSPSRQQFLGPNYS